MDEIADERGFRGEQLQLVAGPQRDVQRRRSGGTHMRYVTEPVRTNENNSQQQSTTVKRRCFHDAVEH